MEGFDNNEFIPCDKIEQQFKTKNDYHTDGYVLSQLGYPTPYYLKDSNFLTENIASELSAGGTPVIKGTFNNKGTDFVRARNVEVIAYEVPLQIHVYPDVTDYVLGYQGGYYISDNLVEITI